MIVLQPVQPARLILTPPLTHVNKTSEPIMFPDWPPCLYCQSLLTSLTLPFPPTLWASLPSSPSARPLSHSPVPPPPPPSLSFSLPFSPFLSLASLFPPPPWVPPFYMTPAARAQKGPTKRKCKV